MAKAHWLYDRWEQIHKRPDIADLIAEARKREEAAQSAEWKAVNRRPPLTPEEKKHRAAEKEEHRAAMFEHQRRREKGLPRKRITKVTTAMLERYRAAREQEKEAGPLSPRQEAQRRKRLALVKAYDRKFGDPGVYTPSFMSAMAAALETGVDQPLLIEKREEQARNRAALAAE